MDSPMTMSIDLTPFYEYLETKFAPANRMCQTGVLAGTYYAADDSGYKSHDFHKWTRFSAGFPSTPVVTLAMKYIDQTSGGDSDRYGWNMIASNVTTAGFTADITLTDRKLTFAVGYRTTKYLSLLGKCL